MKIVSIIRKIIIENKSSEDAITWVIKYFRAASDGYLLLGFFNNGIREIRLISRPIQAENHE